LSAILVDSNVILDVFTEDPEWYGWSSESLAAAADQATLAINPLIYSEVSLRFASIEQLEEALPREFFERLSLPWEAAFLAGKCFLKYRSRRGLKRSPLPDFYIGAHAAVADMRLLTRDPRRYRTYFPRLPLICPSEA
jgi:predicted nucleic acid-binding protein